MTIHLLRSKLKEIFGHDDFKNETQMRAMQAVYEKEKEVYISMPTGSGNSLCFQLPAVLQENKVAIVFSPLITLIKNQIDFLQTLSIDAKLFDSKCKAVEKQAILLDLKTRKPKIKMLYVGPEMAATLVFENLIYNSYHAGILSYIIIEEAHCLSELGHDFIPNYRLLEKFKRICKDIPMIALTATADKEVESDICTTLGMKNPAKFSLPVFRENLYYDVAFSDTISDPYEHLKDFILMALGGSVDESIPKEKRNCGIIYCSKRFTTKLVAEKLSGMGITTLAYHRVLPRKHRTAIQDKWTLGEVPVIAATCAFGRGINKGSVRFVVHWMVPQTVAGYYQESGRAGRDGKPGFCRTYFSSEDHGMISNVLRNLKDRDTQQLTLIRNRFEKMVSYCLEAKCRHAQFSECFGDEPPPCKSQCDSCKNNKEVQARIDEFKSSIKNHTEPRQTTNSALDGVALPKHDSVNPEADHDTSAERIEAREEREAKEMIDRQFALRSDSSCYKVSITDKPKEETSNNVPNDFVTANVMYKNSEGNDISKESDKMLDDTPNFFTEIKRSEDVKVISSDIASECEFKTALQITQKTEKEDSNESDHNDCDKKRKIYTTDTVESESTNSKRIKSGGSETTQSTEKIDSTSKDSFGASEIIQSALSM